MENKIVHPKLGEFIEKVLKVAHVNLSKMCQEIHICLLYTSTRMMPNTLRAILYKKALRK